MMVNPKQIEAAARVLASYELFDWESLPEIDPGGWRDRAAFRMIAAAILDATRSSQGGQP